MVVVDNKADAGVEKPDAGVEAGNEVKAEPALWQRIVMAITPFSYGPKDADLMDKPITAAIDIFFMLVIIAAVTVYGMYTVEQALAQPPQETQTTYTMTKTFPQKTNLILNGRKFKPSDLKVKVSLFVTDRPYDSNDRPGTMSNATFQQAYTDKGTNYEGSLSSFADYDTECPTVVGDSLSLVKDSLKSTYCKSLVAKGFDPEMMLGGAGSGGACVEADLCFAPNGAGDSQVKPPDAVCAPGAHPIGAYQEGINVFVGGANKTIISFSMAYFSEIPDSSEFERNLYRRQLQLIPGQYVYLRAKQVIRVDGDNGNKILSRRLSYSSYLVVPSLGSGHSGGHNTGELFVEEGCDEYEIKGASLINVNFDEDFDVIVVTSTFSSLTIVGAIAGFLGLATGGAGLLRMPLLPA